MYARRSGGYLFVMNEGRWYLLTSFLNYMGDNVFM